MSNGLGGLLDKLREQWKAWTVVLFAVLAVLVAINIWVRPPIVEFHYDQYAGFWPVFGFGIGLVMVIVMKKIVQPMIARDEEFYDRDN